MGCDERSDFSAVPLSPNPWLPQQESYTSDLRIYCTYDKQNLSLSSSPRLQPAVPFFHLLDKRSSEISSNRPINPRTEKSWPPFRQLMIPLYPYRANPPPAVRARTRLGTWTGLAPFAYVQLSEIFPWTANRF